MSVPTGAALELQWAEPLERLAVHRDVDPVEKVTEPVGAPVTEVGVTVAEYVTDVPETTGLGVAVIVVCVGGGGVMTRFVDPVEAANPVPWSWY